MYCRAADLDGGPPAHDQSGVVLPAQAAGIHVGPQADVVPQHVGDPLLCADVVDFNPLTENKHSALFIPHWACLNHRSWWSSSLTTLLAQAMRLALHWMLVMEPSPSWSTDIFQRFSQFLS